MARMNKVYEPEEPPYGPGNPDYAYDAWREEKDMAADALLPQDRQPMTDVEIVDELTYRCYAWNREQAPHVTSEQWLKLFPQARAFEARYQTERR